MASTFLDKDMDAEMKELEEEGIEDSEDEGDSMSGDDDVEKDEEEDPEVLKKISEFEAEISYNPYNYSAHLELVTLLRKTEDFEKLRNARNKFSEYYPLTGELWIEWISDEQKIASSDEDKKMIEGLFEKGVKDYLSVDLWLEYCQHSIGGIGSEEGIVKAREVHEKAITACGLHVSKGSLVWETYKEFEAALLSMMPSSGSEELEKKYLQQKNRITSIHKRQLRIPLLGMEQTFSEYNQFVETPDPHVTTDYNKTKEKLKAREQFESNLAVENSLEHFQEYIDFELKEKEPPRIQMIFERAITVHCLESSVWSQYLTYLDSSLKISTVSLPVFARAVRNVPWSVEIWCSYLRSLERYEEPHREVLSVFEQALSAGFGEPAAYLQLWLCFIDYMRRRTVWDKDITESMSDLRTVFDRANTHLAKCKGDPDFEVSKYCANLEADQFGVMENARKIWGDILIAHPFNAGVWLEYIQLEKTFGDKKHLRKAYQRALEKVFDDPETIVKSFIQFEREEGSLEAYENCVRLCNINLAKVRASKVKVEAKQADQDAIKQEKIEKKKEKDKQYRRDKRQQVSAEKKAAIENTQENGKGEFSEFRKPGVPDLPQNSTKKTIAPPPGFAGSKTSKPPPPGFNENMKRTIAPPPGFKEPLPKKQKSEDGDQKPEDVDHLSEAAEKKLRTVFLSNLEYSISDDDIREVMESSGVILDVRLVKKPDGQSKGYAFVEFEKQSEALEALKRDNELLGQRPLYISKCVDKNSEKTNPIFKYETGLEKNKLFINNLDTEVTRKDLAEVFEKYGKLKEIRLPIYRNGHSKGIAFVDYEDELGAATALIKADNMKLRSKEIRVALSNPPKRADRASQQEVQSLGGTVSKEFGPRGKGRSQVAFTPRSLTVTSKNASNLQPMKFVKSGETTASTPEGHAEGNGVKASKSNDDFRKMLLK